MIEIKKVETQLSNIRKIYLISDVHVRNLKRHEEYNQVFNRLYDYIQSTKTDESIIVLGGDIVHAKTDMTPELVQMVQKFLSACADLCYTILITGNHDCNLNNKSRLDALAPIVNALRHDRLIYLRDSGVYQIANIHFTVMSVFDRPVDFIKASSFTAPYKIALHHGAVDTSVTDTGHVLTNKHVPISMFDGYDLTLLGDIHVPCQYLNKEKTIAYPGSLIQQNYAEALHHGLLVWDVETKNSEFVTIPNDYCFYTLDIDNGQYSMPTNLPNNVRLRLRVKNTPAADIKTILADIKARYNVLETPIQKISTFKGTDISSSAKIHIGDVRDIEYQNQLLADFLRHVANVDDTIIDGVKHVNRKCNTLLQKLEVSRNTVWVPKKFTFSNMFSYGQNNTVDFTKLKGLYGIFAPNAAGKSTLFEALSFCVFDKCNRTTRAEQVLNSASDSFVGKFEFDIGEKSYVIERTGKRMRDHVRVDVNFYCMDDTGVPQSLNGKERSDTNKIIRSYLGSYEDFVLTSLSVQNNNTGFIDMGQKERKDLLAQFLDSDIFEALHKIANIESKDIATIIKDLNRQDLDGQLATANKNLQEIQIKEADKLELKQKQETIIQDTFEEINELSAQLIPLSNTHTDIDKLTKQRDGVQLDIQKAVTDKNAIEVKLNEMFVTITDYAQKLESVDLETILSKLASKDSLQKEYNNLKNQLASIEVHIKHNEEKMTKLDSLEYDENCSYCMNNVFVKDAIQTKHSLQSDYDNKSELQNKLESVKNSIAGIAEFEEKKKAYDFIVNSIKKLEADKLRTENDKLRYDNAITVLNTQLDEINGNIRFYEEHKEAIQKNSQIQRIINDKRAELAGLKTTLQTIQKHLNEFLYIRSSNENQIRLVTQQLERLSQLQKEYSYYQLYMDAFSRDGVPYQLISKALPKIETEVNNILSQVVDYEIHFNTDGKNINTYIVYDTEKYWPLELASGMEKFISSLAIRTALINVSSLPRPPFLVIDEGMGNLDAENLNNMYVLFDYLKTQFEYMIVISHIDSIRDMVDSVIEITKLDNKSSIVYE